MLPLQLFGAAAIFIHHLIGRDFPPESAFAVFLTFLLLVSLGFASSSARIRIPILVLKGSLCLLLRALTPLPLFLLPAIGLELPCLFPAEKKAWPLWAVFAVLPGSAVFLLPRGHILPFLVSWAVSASSAMGLLGKKALGARLGSRIVGLERELAEARAARDALERSAAGQELLAKLEERDRIAGRLHDDLGHAMTGSIMQLEAAEILFTDDPERARKIMGKVALALREGLESVRSSLKSVKPAASLLGARKIQSMLEAFEADHGIAAFFATEGTVDAIPGRVWRAVEGNLREALTNTLRHSSGKRFWCRISVLNGMYKAEFRDDGQAGSPVRRGMGLEGMESRTRESGGTMIVDSSRGFSVIMLFMKGEAEDGHTGPHRG